MRRYAERWIDKVDPWLKPKARRLVDALLEEYAHQAMDAIDRTLELRGETLEMALPDLEPEDIPKWEAFLKEMQTLRRGLFEREIRR